MTRTTLTLIALALALIAATPLHAQEAAPRFFIERIEVRENSRVTPDVVIAESRLREGTEYSESDLRDAANRLTRLPFLLGAEFALERGSERGRHVLVITVNETRSFFFRLEGVPLISEPGTNADTSSRLGSDDTAAALGYRWFLGRRGALHIALIGREKTEFTRGYSAFALGYTAYDLFGTRAFATVNLKHSPQRDGVTPQVVVGVPLSLNQTVTAEYDQTQVSEGYTEGGTENNDTQRLARVTWSYNTTNHPFVPTEGTVLTAGPLMAWRDESSGTGFVNEDGTGEWIERPYHTTTFGVQGSALRYWELTDRNSVSFGAEAGIARVEVRRHPSSDEYNSMYGVVQGGASRSLWSPERRAQGGDSRVELIVRGRARDNDRRAFTRDDDVVQTSLSWVRHSSWGTIRLGAGYAW